MRRFKLYRLLVLLTVLIAPWIILRIAPPVRLYEGKGLSRLTFDRHGNVLDFQVASDGRYRSGVSLSEIPKACIEAALGFEDSRFFYHPGVDPLSLTRAALSYGGAYQNGGSTLTMQLARLKTGRNTRTISGKLWQIWDALVLERHFSKREILNAYFNFAPYGGGIEGIAAASALYFGKPVQKLSRTECAALAVLPQAPSQRFGFSGEGFKNAYHRLLDYLKIPAGERAINLPSLETISPVHHARHVTNLVLGSGGEGIVTTIDGPLQKELEVLIKRYINGRSSLGLKNGSLLVVDTSSNEILSYVGSKDFADSSISGFVNGIAAKRSPGSLLKPFVYAQAIDEGVIIPESVLSDIYVKLTSYEPENFERNFLGRITARQALIKSRNIPALLLNTQLSKNGLYDVLQTAGVSLPRSSDYYGSAVVLGGVELSLEQIIKLYSSLASRGVLSPLKIILKSNPVDQTVKLISAESAYLTKEMLKTNPPPPGFGPAGRVAWKTGTSSGGRDAWAVGIEGRILAGVWLGNFDGTANPNFIGRDIAGPLLFEVLERIHHNSEYSLKTRFELPTKNLRLKSVELCSESGLPVTSFCPHKKRGLMIPGISPIKVCDMHRSVDGPSVFTSDITNHMEQVGVRFSSNQFVKSEATKRPPHITSPESGLEYRLEFGKEAEVEFRATLDGEATRAFWYVDGAFVGDTKPGSAFFWKSRAGDFTVTVTDSFGESDAVRIKVVSQG